MKNRIAFIAICVFTISVIVVCIFLINNNNINKLSDAITFRNEYMNYNDKDYLNIFISEENTFKYKSEKEIIDILNNGTGIIFIGNETDNNSRYIVNILTELAIKNNKDINYINSNNIKENGLLEIINTNGIPLIILAEEGKIIDMYNGNVDDDKDSINIRLNNIINSTPVEMCSIDGC